MIENAKVEERRGKRDTIWWEIHSVNDFCEGKFVYFTLRKFEQKKVWIKFKLSSRFSLHLENRPGNTTVWSNSKLAKEGNCSLRSN